MHSESVFYGVFIICLSLWYDLRGWPGVTHQESVTLFSSTFWLFVPLRSVDGVWEEWGTWSTCSRTCGNGTRSRNRTCTGPFYGGRDCEGDPDHWERCNTFNCPGMPLHRPSLPCRLCGLQTVFKGLCPKLSLFLHLFIAIVMMASPWYITVIIDWALKNNYLSIPCWLCACRCFLLR